MTVPEDQGGTEQAVEHAEQLAALGHLVSGIAHDINVPVSFLCAGLPKLRSRLAAVGEVLAAYESCLGPDKAEALRRAKGVGRIQDDIAFLVEGLQESAQRIRAIASLVHEFSRPSGPGEPVPVDPAPCIQATIGLIRPTFGRHVAFDLEVGRASSVLAEVGMLDRVLMNLVLNACQAVSEGGRVSVRLFERESLVFLEVEDDGSGIADDVKEKVLEPYFTTKEGGTGLGLYISRQIVEKLGGSISVESVPHHRTTFTVTLPAHST